MSSRSNRCHCERKTVTWLVFLVSVCGFMYQFSYLQSKPYLVYTDMIWGRGNLSMIRGVDITSNLSIPLTEANNVSLNTSQNAKPRAPVQPRGPVQPRVPVAKPRGPVRKAPVVPAHRELPPLKKDPDHFFGAPYQPITYGNPRSYKGFLTIGIPTVRRPNTDKIYLISTIDSLIEKLGEADRKRVTIVVLTADDNATYNQELADKLHTRYQEQFESGVLQVIRTNKDIYPNLEVVRKTFNDAQPRLRWRAKQNIDFAYLMLYSRNISQYYLQIEDDLLTANYFVKEIEKFIDSVNKHWFMLEFSKLGFIGKLFRGSDMEYVANTLLERYDERPCDLLLGRMRVARGQKTPIHSIISLFQHIGWFSSLKDKVVPVLDDKFNDKNKMERYVMENRITGDNPAASVFTNMIPANDKTKPAHAYDGNHSTYFWATSPKTKDFITWVFTQPQDLVRIFVETGDLITRKDNLLSGDLEYAGPPAPNQKDGICNDKFFKLVTLVSGSADTTAMGTKIPQNIKCIRLKVRRRSKTWLKVQDLQVFIKK